MSEEAAETPRESVIGVMASLKAAGEIFRGYEKEARTGADGLNDGPGAAQKEGLLAAATRNAAHAVMCERAVQALEGAMSASFQRVADATERPKTAPSPSALFRAGFEYGGRAYAWGLANDEVRPRPTVADFPEPVPPDWQAAWALERARLASGQ